LDAARQPAGSMKPSLTFLLVLLIAPLLRAAETDYRSFFEYPDARIVINLGDGHSEGVPYKNHTNPQKPGESMVFSNGFGTNLGRTDEPFVSWRFIQKTEYGDLYLFTIEQKHVPVKAIPVLFSGQTVFAYNQDGIVVQIDPYKDPKEN